MIDRGRLPQLVYILVVGVIAGGLWLYAWYFSATQTTKRAIRAAPPSTIAQAQPGKIAKLTGRVSYLTEPVRAPFSGRPCAYYLVTVDEDWGETDGWKTILRDPGGVDFLIEDGTGRARVDIRSLKVAAVEDAKDSQGQFTEPTPQLTEYLAKHGQKGTVNAAGYRFNRKLRCREAVFEAGETVAIVGQVGLENDPVKVQEGAGYRENPAQRVVIAAPPGGELLASDIPAVVG